MTTCAVMAAVFASENEKRYVRSIADRFTRVNDIPVRILTDSDFPGVYLAGPHYARYHVWDIVDQKVDRVIYIDTDTLALRPLPPLPDVDFAAATDQDYSVADGLAFSPLLNDAGCYFCSGFFIATRKTRAVFRRVLDRQMFFRNANPSWRIDQTPLNIEVQLAVRRGEITFELLSPKWLFLAMRHEITPESPHILHFSGLPPDKKLRVVHHFVSHLNYVEAEHGMKSGR